MKSTFGIDVNVKLELFSLRSELKDTREIHNAVTTAGLAGIMDQILGSPTLLKMGWMEVGTGTGGTTKLTSYIVNSKVAFTSKIRAGSVITVVGTFPAGTGTGSITEAGTFDTLTQNAVNMWMYASFAAISKTVTDSLVITWTLTAS